jgi:N-acetylmuramoyl-L-alanine amidase
MISANKLIEASVAHIGEEYVFGSIVPMNNPNWKGPWDCAEFVTYIVHSITNVLYGIWDNDSYTGYWADDVDNKKVNSITVEQAVRTEGAILLRKPKTNMIGHIAFSDGKGNTIEARGKAFGVCKYVALASDGSNSRSWDMGIKIPNVEYLPENNLTTTALLKPIHLTKNLVKEVQQSLITKGIYLGKKTGSIDELSSQALYNFQLANNLEPSGLIDFETLELLK